MTTILMLLCTLIPLGQTTQPNTPVIALGEPYADVTFGFTIRPPRDWQPINRREFDGRSTLLLRMMESARSSKPRAIIIEHQVSPRTLKIKDRLRQAETILEIELKDPRTDAAEVRKFDGRPGAYLSTTYTADGEPRFRLTAIVEIAPRNYLVMRHDGRAEDRLETEALFCASADSIRLLAPPLSEKELRKALDEGAEWIKTVTIQDVNRVLAPEQYFLYESQGKPVGVLEVFERRISFREGTAHYEGVEIFQQSWMFDTKDQARRNQNRILTDDELELEKWQSSAVTWVRASGETPEQFENAYQEGLRSLDVLLSSQASSLSEPVTTNPPFRLPRTYLSRTLTNLLPRVLKDLDKPRTLAFLTFDHDLGMLVQKIVELKGESHLPGESINGKVYRIDDRVGIAAEPAQVYVDEAGRILLVKTRNWTLRMTTLADLKPQFEARVNECDEAFRRMEQAYNQNDARFIQRR